MDRKHLPSPLSPYCPLGRWRPWDQLPLLSRWGHCFPSSRLNPWDQLLRLPQCFRLAHFVLLVPLNPLNQWVQLNPYFRKNQWGLLLLYFRCCRWAPRLRSLPLNRSIRMGQRPLPYPWRRYYPSGRFARWARSLPSSRWNPSGLLARCLLLLRLDRLALHHPRLRYFRSLRLPP